MEGQNAGAPNDGEEQERRRRQQLVLWLAMMLFILWMLADAEPTRSSPESTGTEGSTPDWLHVDTSTNAASSRLLYPANVSGNYTGTWERVNLDGTVPSRGLFMPPRAKNTPNVQYAGD
jgi:hypothetical protein